jgi:hypothetical protein
MHAMEKVVGGRKHHIPYSEMEEKQQPQVPELDGNIRLLIIECIRRKPSRMA